MTPGNTFTIRDQGEYLDSPGIDWGGKLEVLFRHGKRLVLRRKGHMAWSGIGSPYVYEETFYMLVELGRERISAETSPIGEAWDRDFALVIERVEPARKWKTALQRLKALAVKPRSSRSRGGLHSTSS